jgi:Zn-dependent protease with chaperone function
MDFFTRQDKARRHTTLLVFFFGLAVVCIVAAVYVAIAIGFKYAEISIPWTYPLWNTDLFVTVAGVTVLIVLSGTLYKMNELGGPAGGDKVAQIMGGRLVNRNTRDLNERKLLNVVEEMAIASGATVPTVYVIEDEAINAFAAGVSPSNAVVAVTSGAMRLLNREELQGVIAHEFSHIFNGDMRLNIRLIGVLHGIILLALIGTLLLRILRGTGRGSRSSGKGGGGIIALIILIGVAFTVVGYIGEFFARLIKMAVSRQREYLADASAVQFTRNPGGIGGALKKIGGWVSGSAVENANAKQVSHLFFADGIKHSFSTLFATHPPLADRIKAIDPRWKGTFPEVSMSAQSDAEDLGVAAAAPIASRPVASSAAATAGVQVTPAAVVGSVGTLEAHHMDYAAGLVSALPDIFVECSRDPFGARAVVYALLLDSEEAVRAKQLGRLEAEADGPVFAEVQGLLGHLSEVRPEHRLPLLELALPALRALSPAQWVSFIDNIEFLIRADERVSLFEFSLRQLVLRQYRAMGAKPSVGDALRSVASALPDATLLLSFLAWQGGGGDSVKAGRAFEEAAGRLGPSAAGLQPLAAEALDLGRMERALDSLGRATPMVKRWIIDSCATCIASDRIVTIEEAELLRVIGSALDCPIPPFVPGVLKAAA